MESHGLEVKRTVSLPRLYNHVVCQVLVSCEVLYSKLLNGVNGYPKYLSVDGIECCLSKNEKAHERTHFSPK